MTSPESTPTMTTADASAPTTSTPQSTMTFDHVAQQVPEVAAAVAWYCRSVPGCRVLYQDATWAFVQADGVKLAFIRQGDHPDHLAWRVSAAELQRLAAEHNKTIRTHRDGTRSFYVSAPGDRWIEFIAYPEP